MRRDTGAMKLTSTRPYFNRELSWLQFNGRVLQEAQNPNVPLLERVRYLSISASNLDEFFMVRVAGLRTQVIAGVSEISQDGYTPARQLQKINKQVKKLRKGQDACWADLRRALFEQSIYVKTPAELSTREAAELDVIFRRDVLPILTPLAIDPAHPFPFIPNLGFGLALSLAAKRGNGVMKALVIMPSQTPRFIKVAGSSGGKKATFVPIESAVRHYAPDLFASHDVVESGLFRITRDSDMTVDEEAEDLILHFEFLLKKRRRGRVVRLSLEQDCPADLQTFLIESFEAWDDDISIREGMLGMSDLSQLILPNCTDLLFPPFTARFPERIREYDGDHFAAIAAKDILVHHPYEEFDVVLQFLKQAAADPQVAAIKQTLYRTSDDSPIVDALIQAAEQGKNVTALVELKARFDEATNLRWARDLERAGAQVVYGFIDLKTHAKVSLVLRREADGLQSYVHLGTGNYHAQNAKVYTDLALFTADDDMGHDVGQVFNFITSYAPPQDLRKLRIAPMTLRQTLMDNITAEIDHAEAGRPAAIWAKMNALVDTDMIDALYAASRAGVQIDLVVRGICCLRPGVPGLSDNIRVSSIVGRYLEHSRIVVFGNGGALPGDKARVYFSSADWMPRNLNRRVETLVPVTDKTVRRQVMDQIMVANLNDETNSWDLGGDGRYTRRTPANPDAPFSAHAYFMKNPSLSGRGKSLQYDSPAEISPKTRKGKSKR